LTITVHQEEHSRNTVTASSYTHTFGTSAGGGAWTATQGRRLIAVVFRNSGIAGLVVNTAGWSAVVGPTTGSANEGGIYTKVSDGTETSIQVSDSGAVNRLFEVAILEVSGVSSITVTASAGNTIGTTSKATGTTAAPSTANYLGVCQVSTSGDMGGSEAWTNSYTLVTVPASNRMIAGRKVGSDGAAQSSTGSWTNSVNASGRIAVFSSAKTLLPPPMVRRALMRPLMRSR
jgi:hypothetical protein